MATRHPLQKRLAPLLYPLSLLYGRMAARHRKRAERSPAFFGHPPVPCISIGNISWGGTGKTPVTGWLLKWAADHGLHAAVLTRGYRARPPRLPYVVRSSSPVEEAGDEPLMMARRAPEASVVVDPLRSRAAELLMAGERHPDLFLLDDAFQHAQMGRHLNLVLLDEDDFDDTSLSNWNRVIPAGSWREGVAALDRADAFLIKTTPERWPELKLAMMHRLRTLPRPVFAFALCCRQLLELAPDGQVAGYIPAPSAGSPLPEELRVPYILATGVGMPEKVAETAASFMGRPPALLLPFPDHHAFSAADAARIASFHMPVLCTAKDAVKLAALGLSRLYVLDAEAEFFASLHDSSSNAPGISFPQWWERWWSSFTGNNS